MSNYTDSAGVQSFRNGQTDKQQSLWCFTFRYRLLTGSSAERMRIDSSGNLGIGTSSPAKQRYTH